MGTCDLCRRRGPEISDKLRLCLSCVRSRPKEAWNLAEAVHAHSRVPFGLPEKPPTAADGVACGRCANRCVIPENGLGYCGVRANRGGRLTGASATIGNLTWYHDPLPTNCVASHVCAAETGAGFPRFAHRPGPETGFTNLAVFFRACNFNCLYCQNWHFRQDSTKYSPATVEELAADVDERTACICYFGGDPTPQLPFALRASRRACRKRPDGILRICWETNGSMHPRLLDAMLAQSLESGGCIKFDLKAWNPLLHRVLTGVSNERTLRNFARAAAWVDRRPVPPLLVASTLIVPGYIDVAEIKALARFIAGLNPDIPYSLLAFHPQFRLPDLPLTSKTLAEECLRAAHDAGLRQVRIGNRHLLR